LHKKWLVISASAKTARWSYARQFTITHLKSQAQQRLPRHFRRNCQTHQSEQSGRNIGQYAGFWAHLYWALADVNQGDEVGGVGGVGLAGFGVEEFFGVAVIGGDEDFAADFTAGGQHAGKTAVDGFYGLNGGSQSGRVTAIKLRRN